MARKHRKEKYIRELKDSLRVEVKTTHNGKRISVSGGTFRFEQYTTPGACWQAAIDSRNRILRQIEDNSLIYDEPTVEELYKRRTDYIVLSKETQRKHNIIFANAMQSLANKKISTVTAADIQRSLNSYGTSHSSESVKRLLTIWKQIYKVCAIEELPVPDKTLAVTKYESKVVPAKRETRITHEQFQLFIEELSSYGTDNPQTRYRTQAIYYALMLQLYAGLRPQEAYALYRDDIDLERGLLHIRRRCGTTATESRQIITTKTRESTADVPIADDLRPHLAEMLTTFQTEPLLADYDGLPFESKVVCSLIRAVSKRCQKAYGFTFTQYMLRHLFAREISKITDPRTLQALMRHANSDMSLYYSWSSDDEMKEAVNNRPLS